MPSVVPLGVCLTTSAVGPADHLPLPNSLFPIGQTTAGPAAIVMPLIWGLKKKLCVMSPKPLVPRPSETVRSCAMNGRIVRVIRLSSEFNRTGMTGWMLSV